MKLKKRIKANSAIREVARQEGTRPAHVRASMQEALDIAWQDSQGDPIAMARWKQLFPDGKKPSLEDFMERLAKELK